jgi:hypothetical protein
MSYRRKYGMIIPYGFARQQLDEQNRLVRKHLTERTFVREAEQHHESAAVTHHGGRDSVPAGSAPSCPVRPASAERPA